MRKGWVEVTIDEAVSRINTWLKGVDITPKELEKIETHIRSEGYCQAKLGSLIQQRALVYLVMDEHIALDKRRREHSSPETTLSIAERTGTTPEDVQKEMERIDEGFSQIGALIAKKRSAEEPIDEAKAAIIPGVIGNIRANGKFPCRRELAWRTKLASINEWRSRFNTYGNDDVVASRRKSQWIDYERVIRRAHSGLYRDGYDVLSMDVYEASGRDIACRYHRCISWVSKKRKSERNRLRKDWDVFWEYCLLGER